MSDAAHGDDQPGAAAELLSRFVADSLELREGAIFDPTGRQLFATDGADWTAGAGRLWDAAEAGEREISYVHVGTEAGEVLAVRSPAGSAIVVSERFPLASLVLSDLRAVLRELDGAGASTGSA
jgi:hypothetical protein